MVDQNISIYSFRKLLEIFVFIEVLTRDLYTKMSDLVTIKF